jgi:hypothetical protein
VLEDNELEILNCLQNIYKIKIKTKIPEPAPQKTPKPNSAKPKTPKPIVISAVFLDAVLHAPKAKSCLSVHEMQLLGQLVVVAFRNTKDVAFILLRNFQKCIHLQIAHMPRQYKLGEECHNKALCDVWIKAGNTWMSYLPQSFNDELISLLFMDIDGESARRVLRKYHNKHLQMNSMDSAALNRFLGLNNSWYVRLMRALHYFVGM